MSRHTSNKAYCYESDSQCSGLTVESANSTYGPAKSVSACVTNGDRIRFHSKTLDIKITQGSAIVGIELKKNFIGSTGSMGPIGPMGPAGQNGSTGPAGENGSTGPAGENGSTGPQGIQGIAGLNYGLILSSPRFEVNRLNSGQIGESGFENQDVLFLSHNIPELSNFSNVTWVIGKQKKNGPYFRRNQNYTGLPDEVTGIYTRQRLEGVPVTEIGGLPVNGGRLSSTPKNTVPVTVQQYRFQHIDINFWDYFSLTNGDPVNATDDILIRQLAKPKGRRRSQIRSGFKLYLRAYIRVDNPNALPDDPHPYIYSSPSNEIVVINFQGVIRIRANS